MTSRPEPIRKLLQQFPVEENQAHPGGPSIDLSFSSAVDAAASGLALYHDAKNKLHPRVGPLTALPAPWPRNSMKVAKALAPVMSVLMDRVSRDKAWIHDVLEDGGVLATDAFNRKLTEVMLDTVDLCPVNCILLRHDFMLHIPPDSKEVLHPRGFVPMKIVEMNTVSVGLSYLSDKCRNIHDRSIRRLVRNGDWPELDLASMREPASACCDFTNAMTSALTVCRMAGATQRTNYKHISLMVTENIETNSIDQYGLWRCLDSDCHTRKEGERSDNPVPIQRTLDYLLERFEDNLFRRDENGTLLLTETSMNGEHITKEVCLVYWRVFYHPRHTNGPMEDRLMDLRRMIEGTLAIKIPNVATQLAGSKEVQKRMSLRSNLEKFLPSELFNGDSNHQKEVLDLLLDCTARQLDPLSDPELLERVIQQDRAHWVLKPQREGGGNNLFGDAMVEKLQELKNTTKPGKTGYVLMELIKPPSHQAVITDIQTDHVKLRSFPADSELGLYSTSVVMNNQPEPSVDVPVHCPEIRLDAKLTIPGMVTSDSKGNILRTKPSDVREGGIHAGFGWLDSAILCPDAEWQEN